MAGRLLAFTALCQVARAFSDTHPIVAWSSRGANTLDRLPLALSASAHASSLLYNISLSAELCDHDAVVLIDQPGLHASDLRTLSPSSALTRTIASAPSSRQFPYVRSSPVSPFSAIGQSVSERCNSLLVNIVPGNGRLALDRNVKHVICMTFPYLGSIARSRKSIMVEHESLISDELDAIASMFPNHLVILAGSPSLSRRQSVDTSPPALLSAFDAHESGVLRRYQLLTPGLISTLLVSFFLLVPIILIGISALVNIQSPLRIEAPKGYNAQEKKNQ